MRPASAPRRRLGSTTGTVTPLYHQVYLVLRDKIRHGELPPDRPLPGEHQLAAQYQVSRVTIRRTLQALELDGLVTRQRGVGTFPVARPGEFRDRYNIGGLTDPTARSGAAPQAVTIAIDRVTSPGHIVRQLGGDGAEVVRVTRLRSFRGEPFNLLTVYLPSAIADRLDRRVLEREPTLLALDRLGLDLARAEQAVTATVADEAAAELLGIPLGSPLIAMRSVFSDRQDRTLAVLEALYRPDRYEYRTTMIRPSPASTRWRPLD